MRTLTLFAIVGFIAQLVDGSLGMAFGITATTLLVLSGTMPAVASAVVHTVEVGTTLASGVSHWRFGNVEWRTALALGLPGSVGAFLGATALARLHVEAAQPVTAAILAAMGAWVVIRFVGQSGRQRVAKQHSRRFLGLLGLGAGALDAAGGGGWGPVTTGTLLSSGGKPARTIGTVNTAEFLVSVGATLGFIVGLGAVLVEFWPIILGMLIGGVLAAPVAAWLVSRVRPTVLGIVVGTALVVLNVRTVAAALGSPAVGWWAAAIALGGIVVLLAIWQGIRRARPPSHAVTPLDVGAGSPAEEPAARGRDVTVPAVAEHVTVGVGAPLTRR